MILAPRKPRLWTPWAKPRRRWMDWLFPASGDMVLDSSGSTFLSTDDKLGLENASGQKPCGCCGPNDQTNISESMGCTCCVPKAFTVTLAGLTMCDFGGCELCLCNAVHAHEMLVSAAGTPNGTYCVTGPNGTGPWSWGASGQSTDILFTSEGCADIIGVGPTCNGTSTAWSTNRSVSVSLSWNGSGTFTLSASHHATGNGTTRSFLLFSGSAAGQTCPGSGIVINNTAVCGCNLGNATIASGGTATITPYC